MATSRTGTAKWRLVREQALARALAQGIHNCPICAVGLDYEYSRRPNSPEPDHIIPYAQGGEDHLDNVQIICRWCNQRKGGGTRPPKRVNPKQIEPPTSIAW